MDRTPVQRHYGHPRLLESILEALARAGKDPDRLEPIDLAPVDELHLRGRKATAETATLAAFRPGTHLLDVGSGLGGPSRHLASAFGLEVTGADLSAAYCHVAAELARRTGLAHRVRYVQADATVLPFGSGAFDGVWTQHASVNVENKAGFYREMARVLRPGGRAAIYDVFAVGGNPHFPVPWASGPQMSFLCSDDAMRRHLEEQGLEVVAWRDDSAQALAWFRERRSREGHPLGMHLLFGAAWPDMARNMVRNLEECRIGVVQAVLERRAR